MQATKLKPLRSIACVCATAIAFIVGLLVTQPARAEQTDIPTVTLKKEGPDRALPLQESFYLQGNLSGVEGAVSVHPVFIRYRLRPFGIAPQRTKLRRPSTCGEVRAALSSDQVNENVLSAAGEAKIADLFPNAPALKKENTTARRHHGQLSKRSAWDRAYIPKPWVKSKEGKEKDWKSLVSNESFFRPGGRYCLLVIVRKEESDKASRALVTKLLREFSEAADDENSAEKMANAVLSGLEKLGIDESQTKRIKTIVRGVLLSSAADLRTASNTLADISEAWPFFSRPPLVATCTKSGDPSCSSTVTAGSSLEFSDLKQPIAALILERLADKGVVEKRDSAYWLPRPGSDPAFEITKLEVRFDAKGVSSRLVYYGDGGVKAEDKKNKLSTMTVAFDGKVTLTVEALTQFALGRVNVGAEYVLIKDLAEHPVANPDVATDLSKQDAVRKSLATSLEELAEASAVAGKARDSAGYPPSTALAGDVVAQSLWACSDVDTTVSSELRQCAGTGSDETKNTNAWVGFKSETPLEKLVAQAKTLRDGTIAYTKGHDEAKKILVNTVHTTTHDLEASVDLKEEDFFDMYITPVAGVAILVGESEPIATQTVGFQVFLYPNQVEEPMWSNGGLDVGRLLGAEFSVRPDGDSYGPNRRYGRMPNSHFPPLFMGALLQPIPYTTVGTGVALFGHRRSTLSQEKTLLRAGWYVSVNVEINFAGFIRNIVEGNPVANTVASGGE